MQLSLETEIQGYLSDMVDSPRFFGFVNPIEAVRN